MRFGFKLNNDQNSDIAPPSCYSHIGICTGATSLPDIKCEVSEILDVVVQLTTETTEQLALIDDAFDRYIARFGHNLYPLDYVFRDIIVGEIQNPGQRQCGEPLISSIRSLAAEFHATTACLLCQFCFSSDVIRLILGKAEAQRLHLIYVAVVFNKLSFYKVIMGEHLSRVALPTHVYGDAGNLLLKFIASMIEIAVEIDDNKLVMEPDRDLIETDTDGLKSLLSNFAFTCEGIKKSGQLPTLNALSTMATLSFRLAFAAALRSFRPGENVRHNSEFPSAHTKKRYTIREMLLLGFQWLIMAHSDVVIDEDVRIYCGASTKDNILSDYWPFAEICCICCSRSAVTVEPTADEDFLDGTNCAFCFYFDMDMDILSTEVPEYWSGFYHMFPNQVCEYAEMEKKIELGQRTSFFSDSFRNMNRLSVHLDQIDCEHVHSILQDDRSSEWINKAIDYFLSVEGHLDYFVDAFRVASFCLMSRLSFGFAPKGINIVSTTSARLFNTWVNEETEQAKHLQQLYPESVPSSNRKVGGVKMSTIFGVFASLIEAADTFSEFRSILAGFTTKYGKSVLPLVNMINIPLSGFRGIIASLIWDIIHFSTENSQFDFAGILEGQCSSESEHETWSSCWYFERNVFDDGMMTMNTTTGLYKNVTAFRAFIADKLEGKNRLYENYGNDSLLYIDRYIEFVSKLRRRHGRIPGAVLAIKGCYETAKLLKVTGKQNTIELLRRTKLIIGQVPVATRSVKLPIDFKKEALDASSRESLCPIEATITKEERQAVRKFRKHRSSAPHSGQRVYSPPSESFVPKTEFEADLMSAIDELNAEHYTLALEFLEKILNDSSQLNTTQSIGVCQLCTAYSIIENRSVDEADLQNATEKVQSAKEATETSVSHLIDYLIGRIELKRLNFQTALCHLEAAKVHIQSTTVTPLIFPVVGQEVFFTRAANVHTAIERYMNEAKNPPTADFICSTECCCSPKIYFTHNFKGCYVLKCNQSCASAYHTDCFKAFMSNNGMKRPKDIMTATVHCPTNMCTGQICEIKEYSKRETDMTSPTRTFRKVAKHLSNEKSTRATTEPNSARHHSKMRYGTHSKYTEKEPDLSGNADKPSVSDATKVSHDEPTRIEEKTTNVLPSEEVDYSYAMHVYDIDAILDELDDITNYVPLQREEPPTVTVKKDKRRQKRKNKRKEHQPAPSEMVGFTNKSPSISSHSLTSGQPVTQPSLNPAVQKFLDNAYSWMCEDGLISYTDTKLLSAMETDVDVSEIVDRLGGLNLLLNEQPDRFLCLDNFAVHAGSEAGISGHASAIGSNAAGKSINPNIERSQEDFSISTVRMHCYQQTQPMHQNSAPDRSSRHDNEADEPRFRARLRAPIADPVEENQSAASQSPSSWLQNRSTCQQTMSQSDVPAAIRERGAERLTAILTAVRERFGGLYRNDQIYDFLKQLKRDTDVIFTGLTNERIAIMLIRSIWIKHAHSLCSVCLKAFDGGEASQAVCGHFMHGPCARHFTIGCVCPMCNIPKQ